MYRILIALPIAAMIVSFWGCGMFGAVVGTEEWSENYALMDGATATAPEMIDGDLKTSGQTSFPEELSSFMRSSPASEAIVTLPEKMSIYRVVINSPNLKIFDIFSDKGDDNWELIKENQKAKTNPVEVRISTNTDKIRIRVRTTTDDAGLNRASGRGGWGNRTRQRAPATINEIELYGFASSETGASAGGTKSAEEEELDQLLMQ
jgi:hypothetical protein